MSVGPAAEGRADGLNTVVFDDVVAVPLLREEELTLQSEVLFLRVTRDHGVEDGGFFLGPENPAEALGFFLSAAKGAGNLDRDVGIGKVDGEVCHLAYHQLPDPALSELVEQHLTLSVGRLAGNQWGAEAL